MGADRHSEKRYTFILKDNLLQRDPDTGREQATISWEVDFDLPPQTIPGDAKNKVIFIPWSALTPTYRGKPKKDAEPLDLKKIKRFSIMMRRCVSQLYPDLSVSNNDNPSASLVRRKASSALPLSPSKPFRTRHLLHMPRSLLLISPRSNATSQSGMAQRGRRIVVSGATCHSFWWLLTWQLWLPLFT